MTARMAQAPCPLSPRLKEWRTLSTKIQPGNDREGSSALGDRRGCGAAGHSQLGKDHSLRAERNEEGPAHRIWL